VLFGIYLKKAPDSVIRGNHIGGMDLGIARRGDGIRLWYSPGSLIEGNVVQRSRDVVMWFSDDVMLRGNVVTHGRYGLHFMYSNRNVLEGNRLERNSVGAFLMYSADLALRGNIFAHSRGPSGYGVGLKDMDGVVAEDNLFIGNRIGVYLDNSPAAVDVYADFVRNVFAFNDMGMAFQPSVSRNRLSDNTFLDNLEQVAVLGRGDFSGNQFTVDGRGNLWSDYRGYDIDGDGVGDLPHRAESLFENLMDREPKLRMFLYSPAQQAIDLAARALPVVKPRPKFEDARPLMQPVALRVQPPAATGGGAMAALAAALLGIAALAAVAGARPFGGFRGDGRRAGQGARP
jgi:nitrous oxidase accessory protein